MHPTEDALDSALIKQKDEIGKLIASEDFHTALIILTFNRNLWETCNYGYKYHELLTQMEERINHHIRTAEHWKTQESWKRLLTQVHDAK